MRIVTRGYHTLWGEIDLVARDDAIVVFIEVKTRRTGVPAEAVDTRKSERIRRAAAVYLRHNRAEARPARFDVVAITGTGRERHLELLKDAF